MKVECTHKKRPGTKFLCKLGKEKHVVHIPLGTVMVEEEIAKAYPSVFRIMPRVEVIEAEEPAPVEEPAVIEDDIDTKDVVADIDAPDASDVAVAPVIESDDAIDEDIDSIQEGAEEMNAIREKILKFRSKAKLDEYGATFSVALDRTKTLKEMQAHLLDSLEIS